ncbi:MAG: M23 family metallopeptidase [Roseivirga sp.]|nr:M23 family metallopeptidase [Roseivirga sp.]
MPACKPAILKYPNKSASKVDTTSPSQPKGVVQKVGLAMLKKMFKTAPVDEPLITRKHGKTADGRFDKTGAHEYRIDGGKGKAHKGVDLKGETGDDVYAAACGTVDYIESTDTYKSGKKGGEFGKYVQIRHASNVYSIYAHLSEISVKKNQKISLEDGKVKIGEIGKTGNVGGHAHLHFEIAIYDSKKHKKWKNRILIDPKDIYGFKQEPEPPKVEAKPKEPQP